MDIMSIIGMIAAWGLVVYGILGSGKMEYFIDYPSVAITIGGTFAALMITFPLKTFASLPKAFARVFVPQKFNPRTYIDDVVQIATDVRKNGILSMEDKIVEFKDDFLKKGMQLAVDAAEQDVMRDVMETELMFMMDRHKDVVAFFEKGAGLAPGFGMIGTLIGLINMLADMSDVESLVSNMAVALITTFYGSMLANIIFLPMANKLQKRSDEEVLCKQIIIEGIIAIVNGDAPRRIEEKLLSYIPPAMRKAAKGGGSENAADE